MQITQPVKHGGARKGTGPKRGSGRYGEPTVPERVPVSLVHEVESLIQRRIYSQPLYVVGKPSEKPGQ